MSWKNNNENKNQKHRVIYTEKKKQYWVIKVSGLLEKKKKYWVIKVSGLLMCPSLYLGVIVYA